MNLGRLNSSSSDLLLFPSSSLSFSSSSTSFMIVRRIQRVLIFSLYLSQLLLYSTIPTVDSSQHHLISSDGQLLLKSSVGGIISSSSFQSSLRPASSSSSRIVSALSGSSSSSGTSSLPSSTASSTSSGSSVTSGTSTSSSSGPVNFSGGVGGSGHFSRRLSGSSSSSSSLSSHAVSSGSSDDEEEKEKIECNRTLYGEIGMKYPLRLTEPLQRFHPFYCEISFSAGGGKFGDLIELTFLSFQVGSFEVTKSQSACQKGHLTLWEEEKQHEPIIMRNNMSRTREGKFCGQMMARKAIYYSQGNNLSLVVYLPPGRAFYGHSMPFSLFLTYRFLTNSKLSSSPSPSQGLTTSSSDDVTRDYGTKITGTYCDRIFENCLPPNKKCIIQSPNYPGFYPGNVTCNYLIRYHPVPKGYRARIIISQSNEYKISIYTGSGPGSSISGSTGLGSSSSSSSLAGSKSSSRMGLQSDCLSDTIKIYDGRDLNSPVISEFCGSGHLPPVISSGPEAVVTLYSAPYHVMFDSRIELNIEVNLNKIETAETMYRTSSTCDITYDSDLFKSGMIRSPSHSLPQPNTSCTYNFISNRPEDKIWIYFISYYVQDLNQWTSDERCDLSSLEILDAIHVENKKKSQINETSGSSSASSSSSTLLSSSVSSLFTSSSSSHYSSSSSSLYTSSSFAPHNNNFNSAVGSAGVTHGSHLNNLHDTTQHQQEKHCNHSKTGVPSSSSVNSGLILSRRSDFYYSNSKIYKYCEKSSPKVCGRSSDFKDWIPTSDVCSFPSESYLSTGPRLTIRQSHMRPSSSFYASPGSFMARFEFIDTKESGDPVEGTDCDRWFFSHKNSRGSVRSSRNLFLFGRGSGNSYLSCSFRFVPRKSERVRIHVTSFNLESDDCHHSFDTNGKFYSCQKHQEITSSSREHEVETKTQPRIGSLILFDSVKSQQINVGCFCSGRKIASGHTRQQQNQKEKLTLSASSDGDAAVDSDWITFDLIGPEAIINFTIQGMRPTDDFNNFNFEARYEFVNGSFPLYNKSLYGPNGEGSPTTMTYVTAGLVCIIMILIIIIIAIIKVGRIKLFNNRQDNCAPDSFEDVNSAHPHLNPYNRNNRLSDHHLSSDLDDMEIPKIWFGAMGTVVDPLNHHNNLNQNQHHLTHSTLNHPHHLNQLSSHPQNHVYSSLHPVSRRMNNDRNDSQTLGHNHLAMSGLKLTQTNLANDDLGIDSNSVDGGVDIRAKMMSFSSLMRSDGRRGSSSTSTSGSSTTDRGSNGSATHLQLHHSSHHSNQPHVPHTTYHPRNQHHNSNGVKRLNGINMIDV